MSIMEFEALFNTSIQKVIFTIEAPLFYEGQYLSGLYFIKKGKVHFFKKRKLQKSLSENQIIGVGPILLDEESNQNAFVERNSEILFVSKLDALKKIETLANFNLE